MAPYLSKAVAVLGGLASLSVSAAPNGIPERRQINVPKVVPAVPAVVSSVVLPVAQKTTLAVAPIVNSIITPVVAAPKPLTTILNPVTDLMMTINPGSSCTTIFSPSSGAPITSIITEHDPTTIISLSTGLAATTVFASGPASVNAVPSLGASASGSASAGLTIMPGVNATTILPIGGGPATTAISAVISGVTTTLMQTGPAQIIVNATQTIPASMLSDALTIIGQTTITPTVTIPVPGPTDLANSLVGQVTSQLNAGVPIASVAAQASSALAQDPALASNVAAAIPGALSAAVGSSAIPTYAASVFNAISSNILPAVTSVPFPTSLSNLISSALVVVPSSVSAQLPGAVTNAIGGASVPTNVASIGMDAATSKVLGQDPIASSVLGLIGSELSAGIPASEIVAQVTSILGNNNPGAAGLQTGAGTVPTEAASLINQVLTSQVVPFDPLASSIAGLATSELSVGVPTASIIGEVTSLLGDSPAGTSIAADLPGALTSLAGGAPVPTEAASLINQVTSEFLPTSLEIAGPAASSLVNMVTSELSAGIPASSILNQVTSILGDNPAAATSIAADLPGVLTSVLGGNPVPTEAASLINQVTSQILPTSLLVDPAVPTVQVFPSAISLGAPSIQTPAGCPAVGGADAAPTSIALQIQNADGSANGDFVNVAVDGTLNSAPATSASPFQFTNIAGSMNLALAGSPAANGSLPAAYLDTASSTRAPGIVIRYSDPSGLGPVVFAVDGSGMLTATNAASGLNTLALDAAGSLVLTSTSSTPTGISVIQIRALAAAARVVAVPDPNATLNLPGSVAVPTSVVVPVVPTTFATQIVSVGPVQTVPVETIIPIAPLTPTVAVPTVPGYAAPVITAAVPISVI